MVEVTVEPLDLESEPEAELRLRLLPLPEGLAEPVSEPVRVPVDETLLPPPLLDPEVDLAVFVDPGLDESVFDAVTDDAVDDGDALSDDAPVVTAQRASAPDTIELPTFKMTALIPPPPSFCRRTRVPSLIGHGQAFDSEHSNNQEHQSWTSPRDFISLRSDRPSRPWLS